jgi:hypothetical protein
MAQRRLLPRRGFCAQPALVNSAHVPARDLTTRPVLDAATELRQFARVADDFNYASASSGRRSGTSK